MAWTYDPDLTSDRDKVRLYIGDIDTNAQLLTDAAVDNALAEHSNLYRAAVECVDYILAKIARDIDRSGVGPNATRDQKTQHYRDLRVDLLNRAKTSGVRPYATGFDESLRETYTSDADITQSPFTRDRGQNL